MKYLYILLLSIFFTNCSSVPKGYLINNNTCHYNYPVFKISKEELVLDQNIQKQLKNKEGDLILLDNENYKNEYLNLGDNDVTNVYINKKINISKWIRYKNNKIRWSLFKYENGNSKINKETHYNEQGKITKVIDYEKGYKICWAEAIEIVKRIAKKDIENYQVTGFNLTHNNLNEFPNAKPEWQVVLDGNEKYNLKDIKVYRIDGVNGKFLRITGTVNSTLSE